MIALQGQGMTVGLMGSQLLAKCIGEQLKGTAGRSGGLPVDCFSWTGCPVCSLVALVLLASAILAACQTMSPALKSHVATGRAHPNLVLVHHQQSGSSIVLVTE